MRTVKDRLQALSTDFVSEDYISDWYGLTELGALREMVDVWCVGSEGVFVSGNLFSRIVLEKFMTHRNYVPVFRAALSCGMTRGSFDAMMRRLKTSKRWTYDSDLYELGLMDEASSKKLLTAFSNMRYTYISDAQEYVTKLHEACNRDLDLEVEPAYCFQDTLFGSVDSDLQPSFGLELDMLECQPVSPKNSLWLSTPEKPIWLRADITSKATYYAHKSLIEPHLYPGALRDLE